MVFIIPIILGAIALGTAGVGIAAGADGVAKMKEAEEIGKKAQKKYESKKKSIEEKVVATQNMAEVYGNLQLRVKLKTIQRFINLIERIGQRASKQDMSFLEGLEGVSPQEIAEYKASTLEAQRLISGGVQAVGAAYAAGQGTIALVSLFGTASTGAAIGGLSGAAAWSSTLAWLGGGSLATGGGGMALGAWVLGGITVGPALMIGGFVLGGQGEEALTKAKEYEANCNVEIAKLNEFADFLTQVQNRIKELQELVAFILERATYGLSELESRPFVLERDAEKFQQVAILIKALAEIIKTPILNSDGKLNPYTSQLKAKYRKL